MIDAERLLADTKKQVVALVDDLRVVADTDPDASAYVATEYHRAHAAGRTAFGQSEWAEGLYAQVAVAWVLGCVFVRFCEDNHLIEDPLLGGPAIRSQIALDHRAAHLRTNPADDDRHWLREVFGRLRSLPATGEIFGQHNPVWADGLMPSADGARKLREELTRLEPETGELRHDFTDSAWDTRFLGDLYQDLSEHAKKTFALLQTPIFVEEFILDRTLDPAIATFGLAETTIIDPTCGSGHFLLGAFARLFDLWVDSEPATNRRELARRALNAIGGIDLNPFAASIARFRLLVAALGAGGDTVLADGPAYEIHIAVGDSLLHGDPPGRLPGTSVDDEVAAAAAHGYMTEDVEQARALLSRSWHVVVGNPPYIIVKDPALNALYRSRFTSCRGKYSLGVPFTERFFQLAREDSEKECAGFVGMITANSFMKREMGKTLIEKWVPTHDLTHVIDSSGAYIPGHGTPTVILLGRNRRPVAATVRAVMGIRGEPSAPPEPEKGVVWSSIVGLVDHPGSSSDYVSVVDLARERLTKHPWSIGGGGAAELKQQLDLWCSQTLRMVSEGIGFGGITGEDDAYVLDSRSARRHGLTETCVALIEGDNVRDWQIVPDRMVVVPYTESGGSLPELDNNTNRFLWPNRTRLQRRQYFHQTNAERGLPWWEFVFFLPRRFSTPGLLSFASVSSGVHFVRTGSGSLFKQSAPVVTLSAGTASDPIVAILNSSLASFWIKQVMHNKGSSTDSAGARLTGADSWDNHFDIDGSKLASFPLARSVGTATIRRIVSLAQEFSAAAPSAVVAEGIPTPAVLAARKSLHARLRRELIAAQERLDWEIYGDYGLIAEDLTTGHEPEPPLRLGERAFEIVLARRMAAGAQESSWFARHGSMPITELPSDWPESYKLLVERRIGLIETDLNVGLIERPEHKRRWVAKSWDDQVKVALRDWLLDRLEADRDAITTTARLAADVRTDAEFVQIAQLYAGRQDVDLAALVAELVKAEAVPYLAALRYNDSGLRKHEQWLATWELQRREDAGDDVGVIPVPPKYVKADFAGVTWDHRGKLDMPKERFISYAGGERETDASLPIGWSGWDHLDQARALAAWYLQAKRDGREAAHLTPLLAGLAELVPWLKQWHDDPNADPALDRPGTQIAALVDTEMRSLGITAHDLAVWRPEKKRSGRPRKATT